MELQAGQRVVWMQTCRGGYGMQRPVPAVVIRERGERVQVILTKLSGETVRRWVARENVRG
jgi:hypothetical protein